jgi:hypothetical protein
MSPKAGHHPPEGWRLGNRVGGADLKVHQVQAVTVVVGRVTVVEFDRRGRTRGHKIVGELLPVQAGKIGITRHERAGRRFSLFCR